MKKYFSMTYSSYSDIKNYKGEYIKVDAIYDGICFRCGFKVANGFCENCTEFGKLTVNDYLYRLVENLEKVKYNRSLEELPLTDLQKECSNFLVKNYRLSNHCLVWAVCGAGKTEITFKVIYEVLKEGGNVCFAIPRIDILYDVYERLIEYFIGVDIVILNSKEPRFQDAQIYVMTTNQIIRFKDCFDLCIVDEVDAFPYEYNPKYDYGVRSSLNKEGIIIYLTSTPSDYLLGLNLKTFNIYRRWHGFDLPVPKLMYFPLESIKINVLPLFLYYCLFSKKRQQMWFVASIKMGYKILKLAQKFETNIEFVYANDEKRRSKIMEFKNKKIRILITTPILERGVTFEDVDVIILDASSELYNKSSLIQIAGRVNRKKEFQNGSVIFGHQGITKTIEEAILQIKMMNSK